MKRECKGGLCKVRGGSAPLEGREEAEDRCTRLGWQMSKSSVEAAAEVCRRASRSARPTVALREGAAESVTLERSRTFRREKLCNETTTPPSQKK